MKKFFYKDLESTNLEAARLIENGLLSDNAWIRAKHQWGGRGQGHHSWVSESGMNMTGTLVLFSGLPRARDQFDLSRLCSLAVADFLELFLHDVKIKWPNDLYHLDDKIGGILIEAAVMGEQLHSAIIGIGLNINQVDFSAEIPNPVSLKKITGVHYDLQQLDDLLLQSLENRLIIQKPNSWKVTRKEYLSKLYRYREFAPFKADGKWFRGRILDVDPMGHLIMEDENKMQHSFAFQEVEYIL